MWPPTMNQYQDPKAASCPSLKPPDPMYTRQKTHDIFPPEAPPEYYYYIYSNGTNTPAGSSRTVVTDESLSSVGTKVGKGGGSYSRPLTAATEQSAWLQRRRRFSAKSRIILGTVGMIVFLLIITGLVVWIGNAFILPQVQYTTHYSQNTKGMNSTTLS
ncbi:hypothetical protein BDB00DRAFT_878571 [Zychaea mexicana]|uniref:uncharacterized protein n=1 Tax=Zychaea mexicana TaxID=64656 RepID=UPI0022FDC6F8|nr:uncharacterized protein BDB00DRAFT_878571 [Zychaea mexicana]KAI9484670.1 hypothetical protein BDB00DRAFT_878571 [Zychaea mexicana]